MSFKTSIVTFNGGNSTGGAVTIDWGQLVTEWQIQTCAGVNVGDPVKALKAAVINKVQASICNVSELNGTWNTPKRYVLTAGQSQVFNPATVHSLAYKVMSGAGTIDINNVGAVALEAGEADSWTASALLSKEIDIACTTGKIVITTLEPD
jgi:hypothetical protein